MKGPRHSASAAESRRITCRFLVLVAVQAAHSIEEYLTGFTDRLVEVTGALHRIVVVIPVVDLGGSAFVLLNVALNGFLLGLALIAHRGYRPAILIAVAAAVLEVANGLCHLVAAGYRGGYFPGSVSAVALVIVGLTVLHSAWFSDAKVSSP